MNYIIKGHDFLNEIQTITQVFYPNEKFTRADAVSETGVTAVSELYPGHCVSRIYRDGEQASVFDLPLEIYPPTESTGAPLSGKKLAARCVKKSMFLCLRAIDGYSPDWGMLTGIRPSKLVHGLWDRGFTNGEIIRYLSDEFFVSETKAALCIRVAEAERKVIDAESGGYSLYIGIPFCPSRCLYCSFTSYPIDKYGTKVDAYLAALEKEIAAAACNMPPDAIYIGGGTPTALDAPRLDRLLTVIARAFPQPREYTVEAGRPDTVDREKLRLLKDHGVNRLSINPQTMNDKTLDTIGRGHTAQQFLDAFAAARAAGHDNINVDIILGLPGEGPADVRDSLNRVLALRPENLTAHTLAVKRASRLKTEGMLSLLSGAETEYMLKTTEVAARGAGMQPYYMYRQKNMLGNFENVGYTLPGFDCVYNVQIMAEVQNILSLGAGAVTKTVDPFTGRIERTFNVKSLDDYIRRIDEMIDRRKG